MGTWYTLMEKEDGQTVRMTDSICEGSGAVNEDAAGFLGPPQGVTAAWVLDGVTGINDRTLLPGASDARWFVERTDAHLRRLLGEDLAVPQLLPALVDALCADQRAALAAPPEGYDPPACCLVALRRFREEWELIRIGDCCFVLEDAAGVLHVSTGSPLSAGEKRLTEQAQDLRRAGEMDTAAILRRLRPQLLALRQRRNRPGGYGVLEADRRALDHVEVQRFAEPRRALLCSDGYHRLVEQYHARTPRALLDRALDPGGIAAEYAMLRSIEAGDPACLAYPRIKPADDAAALALASD